MRFWESWGMSAGNLWFVSQETISRVCVCQSDRRQDPQYQRCVPGGNDSCPGWSPAEEHHRSRQSAGNRLQ